MLVTLKDVNEEEEEEQAGIDQKVFAGIERTSSSSPSQDVIEEHKNCLIHHST